MHTYKCATDGIYMWKYTYTPTLSYWLLSLPGCQNVSQHFPVTLETMGFKNVWWFSTSFPLKRSRKRTAIPYVVTQLTLMKIMDWAIPHINHPKIRTLIMISAGGCHFLPAQFLLSYSSCCSVASFLICTTVSRIQLNLWILQLVMLQLWDKQTPNTWSLLN